MPKDVNKVTINDVAKAAGVSKGTVDRVLHNRGEVSAKSRETVLKVVEELGFKPNIYASMLASGKEHLIYCVIPEHQEGEFWALTDKGVADASETVAHYGVKVESIKYDQNDIDSFQRACDYILDNPPSGLLIAPMFRAKTMKFVKELSARSIPYILIDSKLEDDNYLAYFGMPMYQSGYLCADLLTNGAQVNKVYIVRIIRDKKGLSDPTVARRMGFLDYMSEHYPDTEIENIFINPRRPEEIARLMDELMAADQEEKHIVMFNSRVHLVADYIRNKGIKDCRVVGFDAIGKNIEALKNESVQVLIAQHMDQHTVAAVNTLVDYLILGKSPSKKDNYTQMDIVNRYNCDYYL